MTVEAINEEPAVATAPQETAPAEPTPSALNGDTAPKPAAAKETPTETFDWKQYISEDLRGAKSLESIKDLNDLVKGYVNAQSTIGRKLEDLTPEQIETFYSKLGRPESADGYELELPAGADSTMTDWFRKTAHEAGLSKAGAEKLFAQYREFEQKEVEQLHASIAAQKDEWYQEIKQEFGAGFERHRNLANRALLEFGGEELVEVLTKAGLENHPALFRAFAKAGQSFVEGKFADDTIRTHSGMTPDEAVIEISKLRSDPEFMKHLNNPTSAQHTQAFKRMEELYKIKNYKAS